MALLQTRLTTNGLPRAWRGDGAQPLLWALRDDLQLTGTKYGCGVGACGACTVQVDGQAVRSCLTTVASVAGKRIVTIEGLARGDKLHPVQQAWVEHNVPQCGYCQSGQMMSAATLLTQQARPSDAQIDEAMRGVLCRCGTYERIRKAVHRAAEIAGGAA